MALVRKQFQQFQSGTVCMVLKIHSAGPVGKSAVISGSPPVARVQEHLEIIAEPLALIRKSLHTYFIFADQLFTASDPSMPAATFKPTCSLAGPEPVGRPSVLANVPMLHDHGSPPAALIPSEKSLLSGAVLLLPFSLRGLSLWPGSPGRCLFQAAGG